jgi:putative addiction module component (TIGR02574 family)
MQSTFEEIRQIAHTLPVDQRILLAESLWESAAEDEARGAETSDAWDAEVGRRVAEIKAGTAKTCSLEEIEADLRAILHQ